VEVWVESDRKQLKDVLDAGAEADMFERSEFWRLTVQPALASLVAATQAELDDVDPIKNPTQVIRLQERVKIYKRFVPNLIAAMKQNAEARFDEAMEEGFISPQKG
jgi:hypothetical protein